VIAAVFVPQAALIATVAGTSLLLGLLGAVAAWAGGAPLGRAAVRVVFWGALAMGITGGVGVMFGHFV
jgi:VIT1/CCC1 family predicted Fe2+/Mn2+ transporter